VSLPDMDPQGWGRNSSLEAIGKEPEKPIQLPCIANPDFGLSRLSDNYVLTLGLLSIKYDLLDLSIARFRFTCGNFVDSNCLFLSIRSDLCD
jgi:hypothetical protein